MSNRNKSNKKANISSEKTSENESQIRHFRIKDFDVYGQTITFNFDESNKTVKTAVGGFLTILMVLITIFYAVH